jgi:hypothetical protein
MVVRLHFLLKAERRLKAKRKTLNATSRMLNSLIFGGRSIFRKPAFSVQHTQKVKRKTLNATSRMLNRLIIGGRSIFRKPAFSFQRLAFSILFINYSPDKKGATF